jgi:hypothetical protein
LKNDHPRYMPARFVSFVLVFFCRKRLKFENFIEEGNHEKKKRKLGRDDDKNLE